MAPKKQDEDDVTQPGGTVDAGDLPAVLGPHGQSVKTDSEHARDEIVDEVEHRMESRPLPTRAPRPVEAVSVRGDGTPVEASSVVEHVGDDLSAHRPVVVPEGMDATSSWRSAGALQVGEDKVDAEAEDLIPEGVHNPHGTGPEAGGPGAGNE